MTIVILQICHVNSIRVMINPKISAVPPFSDKFYPRKKNVDEEKKHITMDFIVI